MGYLLAGLAVLVAVLALLRLFADARPADVRRALAWGGGLLGLVLMGLLLASGRGAQALWALVLFGPAIWRWVQGRRAARRFSAPGAGQQSAVETSLLEMGLDHASGAMHGRVKAGRFAGTDLADLDLPQLVDLLTELAAQDPDAVPLLEAWLDRSHPDWRAHSPPPSRDGRMSRAEALAVLGLREDAGEAEVRAAHRRLMRALHPDQGGTDWLAARLNEARAVLLGE